MSKKGVANFGSKRAKPYGSKKGGKTSASKKGGKKH